MKSETVKKIIITLGAIALVIFIFQLVKEAYHSVEDNEAYENYVKAYKKKVRGMVQKTVEKPEGEKPSRIGVTNNNFEGPKVELVNIEHWGKPANLENKLQVLDYSTKSMKFDPDHPSLGLPDVEVKLSSATLYQPGHKNIVEKLGNFVNRIGSDKPRPYKTFTKTILPANEKDTLPMAIEMQMWLFQFSLTISAKPNRIKKNKVNLTEAEKQQKKYPGYWYQKSGMLTADELEAEPKNNRYGNLKVWLRIRPNDAPFYVNNSIGVNDKPEMALGAVYCMGLTKEPKGDDSKINSLVIPSSELSLYSAPDFGSREKGITESQSADFSQYHGTSLSRNDTTENSIWNKDYYVKVYLDNFGTWKEGLFKGKFDDQITYDFMMPVLVEGSWDVMPPYELIPKWDPPKPYHKRGLSVLPQWGLKFGKWLSMGLVVFIGMALLVMTAPGILSGIFKN